MWTIELNTHREIPFHARLCNILYLRHKSLTMLKVNMQICRGYETIALYQKLSTICEEKWPRNIRLFKIVLRLTVQKQKTNEFLAFTGPITDVYSHFTFPHRSMISSAHHGKKKVYKHSSLKNLRSFFASASHPTRTKIEAVRNNMPFEGPGTGLANPSVHFELSIS